MRYRASRYCPRDIKAFSASRRSNSHIYTGSAALYQVTVLICLHRQPGNHLPIKKYFICHYYKCLFLTCNNSNSYSLIFLCVQLEQLTLQFVKSVTFQRQSVKLLDFQLREKKNKHFLSLIIKQAGRNLTVFALTFLFEVLTSFSDFKVYIITQILIQLFGVFYFTK